MIACPYCQSNLASKQGHDYFTGEQRYRCRTCGRRFQLTSKVRARPDHSLVAVQCAECGKETTNPKFCSKSCTARYNNKLFPKRQPKIRYCKHCGAVIPTGRTVCDACNPSLVDWNQRTLKSLRETAKYQAHAKVRDIARYNYEKANLPRVCANCGYDKHVEICHVKAINSFSDDTPVAMINDVTNLVALSPNCHWEFDHDLLQLQ